jgi:tRNA threonylcarbamoyladenosine biosynthesis protein TsaE
MIFISRSPKETKEIAKKILKKFNDVNIFSLEGELGGGKTTFVKGVADFFCVREPMKSPTFVIMRKYLIPIDNRQQRIYNIQQTINNKQQEQAKNTGCKSEVVSCKFKYFYHFDCYRIKDEKGILELGWQEIINNPKNIIFVEWGNKIKKILPKNTLHIKFEFLDKKKRKIIIK